MPGPRPAGSTLNQTAGYVFNFDCREEYLWPILYAAGGINNFDADWFCFDTSSFMNNFGGGTFSVTELTDNQTVALHFAPGPPNTDATQVYGKTGDVMVVDLKRVDPTQTSFDAIASPTNPEATIVLADDFATSGLIYVAPRVNYQVSGSDFANINDDVLMDSRGYFGTLTLDPQTFLSSWTSSQVVNIHVEPGYSFFSLSGSVGKDAANSTLDVLRVQQRLQFFGYVAIIVVAARVPA